MDTSKPNPDALSPDDWCFVCGAGNPIGLRLAWALEADGMSRARFLPRREHQGWSGIVHGGILAALLDEAMAQRLRFERVRALTASLTVRYRSPAIVGRLLVAEARLVEDRGRALRLEANVREEDGTIRAEAKGLCVRVGPLAAAGPPP